MDGHNVRSPVTCPECGGSWREAELVAAANVRRFRTWMVPVFLAPSAALVLLDNHAQIGWRDTAVIPIAVFVVLFAMAYFALRDQRGIERYGTAVVLAEFLWLTSGLLARFLPGLAI